MSTTIDQRVVEMRFNNAQFEAGARTSMSTLDKLKEKLNFTGASKGLEHLGQSANRVNMNGLNSAIDTAHSKFSALEVMGVTALANITNSAVNAGKRIVHALTIAPVTDGWKEYELTMNTIQTIMNSTGKSADEITEKLSVLDEYADKTVYSTADMFENIYKFTNAGIDLDTATKAMIGIANATADAGQGARQASIAYYNLAQSIGTGYLTTIDYKSLNLANIATNDFKQALADAAIASGTLKKIDDDMYSTGKSTYSLQSLFTEGLSDQWATTAVMMDVFTQYGDATTELGNRAYKAATEVKTFSGMMESLKATAGTGWKETWQIIFGDLDEAKEFWTRLTNFIGGIIDKAAEIRNNFLRGFLRYNPFDKLKGIFDKLENSSIGKVAKKIDSITRSLEEYQKVVRNVWRGNYNNRGDNPDRFDLLRKEGWNPHVVQTLVNKGSKYKLTVEDITAAEKKWGVTSAKSAEQVTETVESLSDAKLEELGLTKEEIKLYRQLEEESRRTGKSIQQLMDEMSKQDGRTLLIESLANIGKSLAGIFKSVYQALADVFAINPVGIYWAIKAFHDFTQRLVMSEDTADNLKRTLRGLFSILGFVTDILGGGLKLVLKVIYKILITVMDALGITASSLLEYTAAIGDAIYNTRQWLKENSLIAKTIEVLVPIIMRAVVALMNWVAQNEYIQAGLTKVKNALKSFKNAYMAWLDGLKETDNVPKYIIGGLVNGLKKGLGSVGKAIVNVGKFLIDKICEVLKIKSPSRVFMAIGGFIIAGLLLGLTKGKGDVLGYMGELGTSLVDKFKGIFSKIGEFIKGIDFGKLLAIGLGVGSFMIVNKLSSAFFNLTKPLEGLGSMFEDCGKGVLNFSKGFKKIASGLQIRMVGESIKSIALSVLMLAGALFILSKIPTGQLLVSAGVMLVLIGAMGAIALAASKLKNPKDMGKATGTIIAITLSLFIMASAIKKLDKVKNMDAALQGFVAMILGLIVLVGAMQLLINPKTVKNIDKVGSMLWRISLALLIAAAVIKLAGSIDGKTMLHAIGVFAIFGTFTAALIAVSFLAGEHADKAGKMISKIAWSLLIMIAVIKLASMLTSSEINRGLSVIKGITGFFAALIAVSLLAGQNAGKVGWMMLGMSIALGIVVGVMKLIATMSMEDINKGLHVVGGLEILFGALIAVSYFAGEHAIRVGAMILMISSALVILTGVIFVLSKMDPEGVKRGVAVVAALEILIGGLIYVSKFAEQSGDALGRLAIILGIVFGSLLLLSFMKPEKLRNTAESLGIVMLSLAAVMAATGKMKLSKNIWKTLVPIAGVVALMAGIVAGLSKIPNPENSIGNAIALTIVAGALALLAMSTSKIKANKSAYKAVGLLAAMAGPLLALAIVLGALSLVKNPGTVLANVISLSVLVAAMTAVLYALNAIKIDWKGTLLSIGMLTLMAVPLLAFVGVLALMQNVGNAMSNVDALIKLSTALTLLLIPLSILGAIAVGSGGIGALAIAAGIAALLLMAVPLLAFVGVLALMDGISNAEKNTNLLINLMTVLTDMLVKVSILAPLAVVGVGAITALSGLIIGLGVFATAVGALFDKFPKLEKFLDKGIPILEKLAEGLGSIVGSFVGGIIGGMSKGLPKIGENLSKFMEKAGGFIDGAKTIDKKVLTGLSILAGAMTFLSAASFINGIAALLPHCFSLEALGEGLSDFMIAALPFVATAMMLPKGSMDGIVSLADAILTLTAADILNGLKNLGRSAEDGSSLAVFGKDLGTFGTNIAEFATNLGTFDDSKVKTVQCAGEAIKSLAEAAKALPGQDGIWQKLVGEKSLATFGGELPGLATNIKSFITKLGKFDDQQLTTVKTAGEAINALATAASQIPNQNGLWQKLVGEKSLAKFGGDLPDLGKNIKSFIDALVADGTFGTDQVATVKCACSALVSLADACKNLPEDSWWEKVTGMTNLEVFAQNLPKLAVGITAFATGLGYWNPSAIERVKAASSLLAAIAQLGKLDLKDLGKNLTNFGGGMDTFVAAVNDFVDDMNALASGDLDKATATLQRIISDICNPIDSVDKKTIEEFAKSFASIASEAVHSFSFVFKTVESKNIVKSGAVWLGDFAVEPYDTTKDPNALSKFIDAGRSIVQGFVTGMKDEDELAEVTAAGTTIGNYALTAAKAAIKSNSPSKEAAKIGNYFDQGFVVGILKLGNKVYDAAHNVGDRAKDGLRNAISRISNIVSSDIETQPTIRPVLDLSDVEAGAGRLSSMFNNGPSIGVASHLRAISSGVDAKNQNGDVVGAIDKLRKEVGNVGGTTNNFSVGNVNYSAESDVADAIRTIIRATTVEGRS